MASSSTEPPAAATPSPFPPPFLSSASTSERTENDDDEQLQRMLERMSTHQPAPQDEEEDDDDGEESWHDAREEEDEREEKVTTARKEEHELDLEELESLLLKSTSLKTKANTLFLSPSSTSSALSTYLSAISTLPPRPLPPPPSEAPPSDSNGASSSTSEGGAGVQIEEITEEEAERIERGETDEEKSRKDVAGRIRELRGVCWANVGACYLKMGENKEAVEACTESLLDSPTYVKALHRRATANVAINTWSSLTSAQDDLKLLLPLLPSSPPSAFYKQSRSLLASLPPKIKEKQDKEKDEMMDKLKGLGNSVLGRLGLSTENFKFEPNGAGGYSMNFVR